MTTKELVKPERTQDEIVARIKQQQSGDFLGFEVGELIPYLDFKHAKEFLKPEATEKEWPKIDKTPKEQMIEYMDFAWGKANDMRGISAGRSIDHYSAWLWLDGNEALSEEIQDYQYYGKPQLVIICEYLGIDHLKWDDGERTNG